MPGLVVLLLGGAGELLAHPLNAYIVRPEQSKRWGPVAPYRYGDPFFDAAMLSAFAERATAWASATLPGAITEPPTAASVRTVAVPARVSRDGT